MNKILNRNIANIITFLRILFAPLVFLLYDLFCSGIHISASNYLYASSTSINSLYFLFVLVAILELTDLIDGYVARKLGQVTVLGKIIDPMADTVLRMSLFLSFSSGVVDIPIFIVYIMIIREFIVAAIRNICAVNGFALAARTSGKIKAFIQSISIFSIIIMLILSINNMMTIDNLHFYSIILAYCSALFSVLSLIDYIVFNKKYIKLSLAN